MASVVSLHLFLLLFIFLHSSDINFLLLPQGTEALSTSKSNTKSGATSGKWSLFYALDDKLALSNGTSNPTSGTLVNEFEAEGGVLGERAHDDDEFTTTIGGPIEVAVTITDAPTTTTTTTTSAATSTTLATTTTLQNNSTPVGTHPRMTGKRSSSI